MPSIPPSAYQVTTPNRTPRPSTNQQVSYYKPTTPFRAAPPPPPSVTTQPVSYYKPTTPPIKLTPPPASSSLARAAKFFSKIPKGGGAALAIAFELLFPPPAGDNYYDRNPKNPPSKYKLQPPEPPKELDSPSPPPFSGGQSPGTLYAVTYELGGSNISIVKDTQNYYGPISGIDVQQLNGGNTVYSLFTRGFYFYGYKSKTEKTYVTNIYGVNDPFMRIIDIRRVDEQPDTGGNPPPLSPGSYSPPGNYLGPPSAAPPSAAPVPAPKAPSPFGSPSGAPGSSPSGAPGSSPSGAPGSSPSGAPGDSPKRFPGGLPGGFPSPDPPPNPGPTPQPNKYPDPAPGVSPAPNPNGDPGPSPGPGVGPGDKPAPTPNAAPAPTPWGNRSPAPADPTKYPDTGFQPNVFRANPLVAEPSFAPNPLEPKEFSPNPNTGNPEPKAPPLVTPNRSPDPPKDPNDDLGGKIGLGLGVITTILAGITALVQPGALQNAANAGSCQSFAPGGCNAPIGTNAADAARNSANNGSGIAAILAFLQALQTAFMVPILAGVNLVNTKLGPLMSGIGGIGGFLSRTAQAAGLDKALNAMNTVLLLHNAAMLSRNLGSTLGDLTGQALSTIGIKDSDGAQIDINAQLGMQVNSFMIGLVGAEVWAGTKTSWNKASSIVASATNIMYTMRSMFDSAREVMEWTAENTGKIGNSLKKFRVVGENAFKWMPERLTVQNKFTQRLDKFRDGTESLDDAASSLQGVLGEVGSIQSEYTELQEQKQKFDASIKAATPKVREENTPVATSVIAAKTASAAPVNTDTVFRGEGSTTDA